MTDNIINQNQPFKIVDRSFFQKRKFFFIIILVVILLISLYAWFKHSHPTQISNVSTQTEQAVNNTATTTELLPATTLIVPRLVAAQHIAQADYHLTEKGDTTLAAFEVNQALQWVLRDTTDAKMTQVLPLLKQAQYLLTQINNQSSLRVIGQFQSLDTLILNASLRLPHWKTVNEVQQSNQSIWQKIWSGLRRLVTIRQHASGISPLLSDQQLAVLKVNLHFYLLEARTAYLAKQNAVALQDLQFVVAQANQYLTFTLEDEQKFTALTTSLSQVLQATQTLQAQQVSTLLQQAEFLLMTTDQ